MEAALGEAETRRRMGRIEQDLAVARSIQQALLPRTAPAIPGFDIAGWNRPADQTGGDYYDWQAMPDGTWLVSLADVSGHGIGPALVTAACRAYMRASSLHHRDLPSLASRINRLLADDLPEGRFITMVSVLIDPRAGPLALLSAGHGPIVLYMGGSGEVRDVLPKDLPLAIEPEAVFGPAQGIALEPGDVLALVTDGFVEWARHDGAGRREQFGMERLRESFRRHARLPAAAMIEAITADVTAFAGQERQQDDLTMVIIRRDGLGTSGPSSTGRDPA
jgi:phosphoserine phosphatase RsbU/P